MQLQLNRSLVVYWVYFIHHKSLFLLGSSFTTLAVYIYLQSSRVYHIISSSYCTVLYCTVLVFTVLYCIVLYWTVLYCILYCTVLYCSVLYCTVLYTVYCLLYCIVCFQVSRILQVYCRTVYTVYTVLNKSLILFSPHNNLTSDNFLTFSPFFYFLFLFCSSLV